MQDVWGKKGNLEILKVLGSFWEIGRWIGKLGVSKLLGMLFF